MNLECWQTTHQPSQREEQQLNGMRTYIETYETRRYLSVYPELFINQLNDAYPNVIWKELDYTISESSNNRHEELRFNVVFEETRLLFVFQNDTDDYIKTSYVEAGNLETNRLSPSQQTFVSDVYRLANHFLSEYGFNRLELLTSHFEEIVEPEYEKILEHTNQQAEESK